ncbi:mitochondrial import receptor subunit TOM40 homolog [Colias croceus]|uniref:mitochondrial import receptor subunit TOM40 homolog n=1 Tax=Colias crocea TaxID=72248 RepID=UPI001E27D79C|nr:mitochondrial import receptor subunit TOM40 homolog [Colias croceus]
MDLKESKFKEEVNNFVMNLQKLLPKKKDIIILQTDRTDLTKLSDIHAEAKSVFPKCFIGAKLVILKEIMDKAKLVQNYNFGKPKDSYKCYSHFIHKEMQSKNIDDGLVIDLAGSATATYREALEDNLEIRMTTKIKNLISSEVEAVLENTGDRSVSSFSMNMKDVDPKTVSLITQWTYKVKPEFSVGMELRVKPLSTVLSTISVSSRYERPTYALSSTVSNMGFQLCLFKQFASDLRMATILNENKAGTVMSVALHKSYENSSELKIFVDTQRCGGFTIEKDVMFSEASETRVVRLMASSMLDRQRRVRFGFGFQLDF